MKEKFLKGILILLSILIAVIAIFLMPVLASWMASSLSDFSFLKLPALITIYISLLPFYLGIYQVWKLVGMIYGDRAFSREAIRAMAYISKIALSIFIIYILAFCILIFLRVPFTTGYLTILILALACLAFSIFADLTKKLIKKALAYKEENDLTI